MSEQPPPVKAEEIEYVAATKARCIARADRLDAWAMSAEAKATKIDASLPDYLRDPAFLTQPGTLVQRERDRITARERTSHELRQKAAAYRSRASNLRAAASRNAGDAEARRQEARDQMAVAAGDVVDSIYGPRRVLKVNAKSLRLEGSLGPITIDKALCKIVRRAA